MATDPLVTTDLTTAEIDSPPPLAIGARPSPEPPPPPPGAKPRPRPASPAPARSPARNGRPARCGVNGDRPAAQVVPAAAAIVVDETLATEVPPPAGAMPAPEATRAADMGRAGGTVGGRRVRGEADSA